ncbi:hypothetical protein [Mycobacterium sp. 1465703.0]|uniref:hypothetical protein n=1 Tax=Mycobacterium sp. 1465703.0 TaxID=1834078 RepID=UPI000801BABA|nr:hypothetical protein [Mycobacterium sp. 1465703.0]OBJ05242.1 hypothetical protein A5625_19790 [Mycobacterium sp. 1465703.0]
MDKIKPPLLIESGPVYWSFAVMSIALGVVLIAAPANWYGPSWHYFPQLPHNGFGMGVCCCAIGLAQVATLAWRRSSLVLSVLFFLGGFVFWTAGMILGAEGILGRQGLMEAPFMLVLGGHKLALSASLMNHHRAKQGTQE